MPGPFCDGQSIWDTKSSLGFQDLVVTSTAQALGLALVRQIADQAAAAGDAWFAARCLYAICLVDGSFSHKDLRKRVLQLAIEAQASAAVPADAGPGDMERFECGVLSSIIVFWDNANDFA